MIRQHGRIRGWVGGGLWSLALALLVFAVNVDLLAQVAAEAGGESGGGLVNMDEDQLPPGAVRRYGSPRFRDGGEVQFLAYSPDGKRLLSIAGDILRVRELPSGKVVAQFPASSRSPMAAISPDGRLLAVIQTAESFQNQFGGTIALFDMATGKLVHELRATGTTYSAFAFSADSQFIFAGAYDSVIHKINCATGETISKLEPTDVNEPGVARPVETKDGAPRGIFNSRFVRLPILQIIHAAEHDTLAVMCSSTMPDGPVGMSRVVLWNLKDGKPRFTGAMVNERCELLLTGKTLTSVYPDKASRSWDLSAGQTYEPDVAANVHRNHTKTVHVIPSPDGRLFGITMSQRSHSTDRPSETVFYLTDASRNGGEFLKLPVISGRIAFSPDGSQMATASTDGVIGLWSTADRKRINKTVDDEDVVLAMAVTLDGKRVATAGSRGIIRVHDVEGQKPALEIVSRSREVMSMGFSPDGASIALASRDGRVELRNVADGSMTGEGKCEPYNNPVAGNLVYSDDGRYFAFPTNHATMVWDAIAMTSLKAPPAEIAKQITRNLRVRISPGNYTGPGLVSSSFFAPSVGVIQALHQSRDWSTLSFNRDASVALHSSMDVITLYDTATGKEIRRLYPSGPLEPQRVVKQFTHVNYSPDDRWIVAVQNRTWVNSGRTPLPSVDQIIRVFDAASGTQVLELEGHRGRINAMSLGTNGRLFTGGEDGTLLEWDLNFRKAAKAITSDPAALLKIILSRETEDAQAGMVKVAADDALAGKIFDGYIALPGEDAQIEAQLSNLASDDFVTRFKALRELAATAGPKHMGGKDIPSFEEQVMRCLLRPQTPADAQRRARSLLTTHSDRQPGRISPAQLRLARVIKTLEWNGSAIAQEKLTHLAQRLPADHGADKAQEALARIKQGTHRADMPVTPTASALAPTTVAVIPQTPNIDPVIKPVPAPEPPPVASDLNILKGPIKQPPLPKGAVARFGDAALRHGAPVQSVSLHPDGRTLVSSSTDETVRFWDLTTGAETKRLQCSLFAPFSGMSPDGRRLAFTPPTPNEDRYDITRRAQVLEMATGLPLSTMSEPMASSFAFSHDGQTLASLNSQSPLLFDAATGKVKHKSYIPADILVGATFNAADSTFSVFRETMVAPATPTAPRSPAPPPAPGGPGAGLQRKLTMQVWDTAKAAMRFEVSVVHTGPVNGGERNFLAGSQLSPDGKTLHTIFGTGVLVRWNIAQAGKPQVVDAYGRMGGWVHHAAFSPDLKSLAIELGLKRDQRHGPLDAAQSKLLLANPSTLQSSKLLRTGPALEAITFSQDGRLIAAGGHDNAVSLFDARTGRRLSDADSGPIVIMKLSGDGNTLALGLMDGTIVLRKASDGTVIRKITGSIPLLHLAFKPGDDNILGASYRDYSLRSWDLTTGRSIEEIAPQQTGSPQPSTAPAWNGDGKFIRATVPTNWWKVVSSSENNCISDDGKLMGTGTRITLAPTPSPYPRPGGGGGAPLMTLKHLTTPSYKDDTGTPRVLGPDTMFGLGCGFARDNQYYALAVNPMHGRRGGQLYHRPRPDLSHANLIYVWNLESQKEVACFAGHDGDVTAVVFSPKNDLMYTASLDGTVLVWTMPPAK